MEQYCLVKLLYCDGVHLRHDSWTAIFIKLNIMNQVWPISRLLSVKQFGCAFEEIQERRYGSGGGNLIGGGAARRSADPVVMDDVWEQQHWDYFNIAFPNQRDKTSRLILTTRNKIVAKHDQYVLKMKLLDPKKSWELFLKKAFINTKGTCPEELESIGRQILEKCDGLPLAISVVGGLLVDAQHKRRWQEVLDQIDSNISENNVPNILGLSYQNLSPQLKSCFLCLAFFKEDFVIHAKRLVNIWAAQGLIQEKGSRTVEEIGRDTEILGSILPHLGLILIRNLSSLTSLKLKAEEFTFKCPAASVFPPNLSHLTLARTRDFSMEELGKLPKLQYLTLKHSYISEYMGRMKILRDGFPCLKALSLKEITSVTVLRICPNTPSYHLHNLEVLPCKKTQRKWSSSRRRRRE
ncbi:disease susceptibility protein LOV1-like [Salvia divinorum]|uniref:Disease susceptibility protein LOV1-like n=1 Tax=Salvia divinorum TaxID=28513 RepID=A0ABD1H7A0_SALDI